MSIKSISHLLLVIIALTLAACAPDAAIDPTLTPAAPTATPIAAATPTATVTPPPTVTSTATTTAIPPTPEYDGELTYNPADQTLYNAQITPAFVLDESGGWVAIQPELPAGLPDDWSQKTLDNGVQVIVKTLGDGRERIQLIYDEEAKEYVDHLFQLHTPNGKMSFEIGASYAQYIDTSNEVISWQWNPDKDPASDYQEGVYRGLWALARGLQPQITLEQITQGIKFDYAYNEQGDTHTVDTSQPIRFIWSESIPSDADQYAWSQGGYSGQKYSVKVNEETGALFVYFGDSFMNFSAGNFADTVVFMAIHNFLPNVMDRSISVSVWDSYYETRNLTKLPNTNLLIENYHEIQKLLIPGWTPGEFEGNFPQGNLGGLNSESIQVIRGDGFVSNSKGG